MQRPMPYLLAPFTQERLLICGSFINAGAPWEGIPREFPPKGGLKVW